MKNPFKSIGRYIGKINNSRAANAVDRLLERPSRRLPVSVTSSVLANLAGGASAAGVFFGKGETFWQKSWDGLAAVPNMFLNLRYYLHLPEYIGKANATSEYLREHGPQLADSLGYAGRKLEAGTRLAQKGFTALSDGLDYMVPGGDFFNPIKGYGLLKSASDTLSTARESIEQGGEQLQETAGPVIEALKQVDLNPIFDALHNLADNVYVDEIGYTLGLAAICAVYCYASSQYIRGYWVRRGRPGILSRAVQRAGIKRFKKYYARHPEKMVGGVGVDVYNQHLIQNPDKLEELVRR